MRIKNLKQKSKRFKGTSAIIFILLIGAVLFSLLLKVEGIIFEYQALKSINKLQQYQVDKIVDLAGENEQLREKLENSSKVQVPEATKQVVKYYLKEYFGDKAGEAEKVFTCESGLSPLSVNTSNKNGSIDRGLAQINSIHAKRFEAMYGVPWEVGAHDIKLAMEYSKFLYDHSGFNPWVCSRVLMVAAN